jgi:hypothetical protein
MGSMGRTDMDIQVLSVNLKRWDHFGYLGVYGKIILKRISKREGMSEMTKFIWLRIWYSAKLV